eukprot:TRINITY_DN11980_c0_g1_i4.p1 TRINITY_DN11980_c0_g1~~TRINITY_DN11980_c0_g1_i4.p1  ORF type:complete len:1076 (+),score=298.22 TRINITY_DN11980_c0_g1_i4:395-3622(+)
MSGSMADVSPASSRAEHLRPPQLSPGSPADDTEPFVCREPAGCSSPDAVDLPTWAPPSESPRVKVLGGVSFSDHQQQIRQGSGFGDTLPTVAGGPPIDALASTGFGDLVMSVMPPGALSGTAHGPADEKVSKAMDAVAGAGALPALRQYVSSEDSGFGMTAGLAWELLKRTQLSDDALRALITEFAEQRTGRKPRVLQVARAAAALGSFLYGQARVSARSLESQQAGGMRHISLQSTSFGRSVRDPAPTNSARTGRMRRYLSTALGLSTRTSRLGDIRPVASVVSVAERERTGAEPAADEQAAAPGTQLLVCGDRLLDEGGEMTEHAERMKEAFAGVVGEAAGADETQLVQVCAAEGVDEILARWLFQALAGERRTVDVRSYVAGMLVLTHGSPADRMLLSFHIFDRDRDNCISVEDLVGVVSVACEENKLKRSACDIEALAKAIMHSAGATEETGLCLEAFSNLLKKHPELAETLAMKPRKREVRTEEQEEDSCMDKMLEHKRRRVWMLIMVLGHIGCFVYMFIMYSVGVAEKERDLMGWSLPFAKGCAGALKLSFALLLFPVSRHTMTALRATPLAPILPLDDAITFHRMLACIGGACSVGHALAHVNDVKRWCDRSYAQEWLAAVGPGHVAADQPSCGDLLKSPVAITGVLMIVIFLIGFPFAVKWPREAEWFKNCFPGCAKRMNDFNHFWITHQLLILFYILLVIHPWPGWNSKSAMDERADTWVWVGVPMLIYFLERLFRMAGHVAEGSGGRLPLLEGSKVVAGKVTRLRVRKPDGWSMCAGQWAFVQVPRLSRYEWHPFTISSAPADKFIEFHIRSAGDWTGALYDLFKELEDERKRRVADADAEAVMLSWPKVRVDGPFGAPAQHFARCPVAILVGAGIGMTPFLSILRDFMYRVKAAKCGSCGCVDFDRADFPVKRAHFFFITRDADELSWVKEAADEIVGSDKEGSILVRPDSGGGVVDINLHVTSMKGTKSFSGALLAAGETEAIASGEAASPLSGVKGISVRQGRPNWASFLGQVRRDWESDVDVRLVSVSFCGPAPAANALRDACDEATDQRMRFAFKKESFG